MRIANWALTFLLIAPLGVVSAQQEDSLAAASRRAQEEKKTQPKSGKVWDNDNIPTGNVNVVGQTPSAEGQPAAETAATEENAPSLSPEEKSAIEEDLKAAKAKLDSVKADADILQRKFTLDSQMYYGKPNYAADKAGAAAISAEKAQVDAKMAEVAAAQKEVDALQAKLKAAGGSDTTSPSK